MNELTDHSGMCCGIPGRVMMKPKKGFDGVPAKKTFNSLAEYHIVDNRREK